MPFLGALRDKATNHSSFRVVLRSRDFMCRGSLLDQPACLGKTPELPQKVSFQVLGSTNVRGQEQNLLSQAECASSQCLYLPQENR